MFMMSSDQFVHGQPPIDGWSLQEKLALASSVIRSGDQNWASVSRTLHPFGKTVNPSEWFSQKNCALQYKALLETVGTTKRKRGENDTAGDLIVQQLVAERIAELQQNIRENRATYKLLKKRVAEVKSGLHDDKLKSMWEEINKKSHSIETEIKTEIKEELKEELKEEIVSEEIMVEEVPNIIEETEIKTEEFCNTPEPCNEVELISETTELSDDGNIVESNEFQIKVENNELLTSKASNIVIEEDAYSYPENVVEEETVSDEVTKGTEDEFVDVKEEIIDNIDEEIIIPASDSSVIKVESQVIVSDDVDNYECKITHSNNEDIKDASAINKSVSPISKNTIVFDEASSEIELQNVTEITEDVIIQTNDQIVKEEIVSNPVINSIVEMDISHENENCQLIEEVSTSTDEVSTSTDEVKTNIDNCISPKISLTSPRIRTSPKLLSQTSKSDFKEHRTGKLIPEPELKAMEEGIGLPIHVDDEDDDDDDDDDPDDEEEEDDDNDEEEDEIDDDDNVDDEVDDLDEEEMCAAKGIISDEDKVDKSDMEENAEPIKSVSSATEDDNVLSPVSSIETDSEIVRGKCVKAAMKITGHPSIEALQKTDIESSDDETAKYDRYSDTLALTPRPHIGFSESVPSSPMSVGHSDTEDEKSHKIWKKSIMLVWRSAANHKYANLFLHPVTDSIAPGYSIVVIRPLDLGTIKRNIENGLIKTTAEFQRDMMLMFSNALMYNSSDHNVYKMTLEMYNDVMFHIEQYINTQIMVNGTPKMLRPNRRSEVSCEREDEHKKRKIIEQEGGKVKKRKL